MCQKQSGAGQGSQVLKRFKLYISNISFQNNVCTLAGNGGQVNYADIAETYYPHAIGGRYFDNVTYSPFFNYQVLSMLVQTYIVTIYW